MESTTIVIGWIMKQRVGINNVTPKNYPWKIEEVYCMLPSLSLFLWRLNDRHGDMDDMIESSTFIFFIILKKPIGLGLEESLKTTENSIQCWCFVFLIF